MLALLNDPRVVRFSFFNFRYFSSWLQHYDIDVRSTDSSIDENCSEEDDLYNSNENSGSEREDIQSNIGRSLGLFIQMELCTLTLHDWLENRNSKNEAVVESMPEVFCILQDILAGLHVMHSNNCIHRDVKPRNIFFKKDDGLRGIWKIGDFGLATKANILFSTTSQCFPVPSGKSDPERTKAIGTVTYASPEQLDADNVDYTSETDMYSLGIIFFELIFPFRTAMERAKKIADLRKGVIPDETLRLFPKECALILWMTAFNSDHRPSAIELLDLEIFHNNESENFYCKTTLPPSSPSLPLQLSTLKSENRKLRIYNENLVLENQMLKKKVEELKMFVAIE
jgi:serine/threonine protein kinase